MLKIILDTNFLALPFKKKVDIYELIAGNVHEPYQLVVLEQCMNELKRISPPSLQLAKQKVSVVKEEGKADQAIYDYAVSNKPDAMVCTQDFLLRRMLSKSGVKVASWSKGRLRIS